MAKLIWQVGLPNISEAGFAMEQDYGISIATATVSILNWLSMLANSIQEHKATLTYQEHARKSGTQKNKSGLTEIELRWKEEKKRAAREKYGRQPSTASGRDTWQAPAQWQWHAACTYAFFLMCILPHCIIQYIHIQIHIYIAIYSYNNIYSNI